MSDPLNRDKRLAAIRKKMSKDLKVGGIVFGALAPALEGHLAEAARYADFRQIENERQFESLKAVLHPYIYNENVVVTGNISDKHGNMKRVEGSHFDTMIKAINTYLNIINMQNKMWGLYSVPVAPSGGVAPEDSNLKNYSIKMVQELQRIARQGPPKPQLMDATVVENGLNP